LSFTVPLYVQDLVAWCDHRYCNSGVWFL